MGGGGFEKNQANCSRSPDSPQLSKPATTKDQQQLQPTKCTVRNAERDVAYKELEFMGFSILICIILIFYFVSCKLWYINDYYF